MFRLRKSNLLTSSSITFVALRSSVSLDVIIVCAVYGRVIQFTIQMVGGSPVPSVFCIFVFLLAQGDCQCSEGHLQPDSAFPVTTQLFLGKNARVAAFSRPHFSHLR